MVKLGKNEPVHGEILIKICAALQCDIKDVVDIRPEDNKDEGKK